MVERASTLSVCEPTTSDSSTPRPCEPITMRSHFSRWAPSTICWQGGSLFEDHLAVDPAGAQPVLCSVEHLAGVLAQGFGVLARDLSEPEHLPTSTQQQMVRRQNVQHKDPRTCLPGNSNALVERFVGRFGAVVREHDLRVRVCLRRWVPPSLSIMDPRQKLPWDRSTRRHRAQYAEHRSAWSSRLVMRTARAFSVRGRFSVRPCPRPASSPLRSAPSARSGARFRHRRSSSTRTRATAPAPARRRGGCLRRCRPARCVPHR